MDPIAQLSSALEGRYVIDREIGAGGMATVYLARDVRHDRRVAVKLLKPELGAVLGVERFLAEIKVTANLQHPNLLPLFDSGEVDGLLFYVMPYVEGESLRARIDREKQLPVDEALRIAVAVASALDYAHRHGVIHRDLKPENILLHDGQPLVADFGIALAVSNAGGNRITQTGLSLGTPQYMSPEQATGDRAIDARTDIFSLGAVTYEMLCGEPPHYATTAQAIIARLLTERPRSLRASRPSVPEHVELAVERALEKLPADRWATPHEFSDALQGKVAFAATTSAGGIVAAPRHRWRAAVPWAAAAMLALGAWGWALRRPAPAPRVLRFALSIPASQRFTDVGGSPVILSPDGKAIVYAGRAPSGTQLYYRPLAQLTATPLPGTENASSPTFSPDGEWVAFSLGALTKISKVSVHGGAPATVASLPAQGMSWGVGDVLIVGTSTGLFRVAAGGGIPERLTSLDTARHENGHSMPLVLPDGKTVLFWITANKQGGSGVARPATNGTVYLGRVRLDDKNVVRLEGDAATPVAWVDGTLLFGRLDGTLAAMKFDPSRTTSVIAAVPVLEGVLFKPTGGLAASVSTGGDLAYARGSGGALLTLLDAQGKRTGGNTEEHVYFDPRFSPDGRRVAVTVVGGERNDIWIYDIGSGVLERRTSQHSSSRPAWTHDGRRIAYVTASTAQNEVWWVPFDGSGPEERMLSMPGLTINAISLSPDGRYAVVVASNPTTRRDIYLVDLQGDRKPVPIVQSEFQEWMPAVSPDGRWLVYVTDESGREQVYARPFPKGGARVQLSTGGGTQPRWSPDSRAVVYLGGDRLIKASLAVTSGLAMTRQDTLFEANMVPGRITPQFDIGRNGSFVMARPSSQDADVIVVTDWMAEVRTALSSGARRP